TFATHAASRIRTPRRQGKHRSQHHRRHPPFQRPLQLPVRSRFALGSLAFLLKISSCFVHWLPTFHSPSRNKHSLGLFSVLQPPGGIIYKRRRHLKPRLASFALSLAMLGAVQPISTRANDELASGKIKHVLLISVDGLHALDVSNYVAAHSGSAFAELSRHGVTYSNARTPADSDSFPGLLALITGGSPISHRLFYPLRYDPEIFSPT